MQHRPRRHVGRGSMSDEILISHCHTCGKEGETGVDIRHAAVPFVPITVMYCKDCVMANAHPLDILAANTAMSGVELSEMLPEWQKMVADTLTRLNISRERFDALVIGIRKDLEEGS